MTPMQARNLRELSDLLVKLRALPLPKLDDSAVVNAVTEAHSPTAVVNADATNCVICHTSEETLQKLAKEEEPAEKLSEGEG